MRKSSFISVLILYSAVAFAILVAGCSNNINKSSGTVVVVDRGPIEISVEASGVVKSENEVVILCPATSIIKKINKESGSPVVEGEAIIELDTLPIKREIEQLEDQLDVLRNNLEKLKLNDRSTRIDLDYNVETKQLRVVSLHLQLTDEKQLLSVGGISAARIEETEQSITMAEKELEMTIEKNEIRKKQLRAEDEGMMIQVKIQEKRLAEKIESLNKMVVKAPSSGILLSVSGQVGEKVNADNVLVRISNPSTLKITGSADEKLSEYIKNGNLAYALIDNEKLPGTIENISPIIENNKFQFNVYLKNANHPKLVSANAVRLQVVYSTINNALRIPGSDEFNQGREQAVKVRDSAKVIKKNVLFGKKGSDFQEIVSGLVEGDQVILTSHHVKKVSNNSKPKN